MRIYTYTFFFPPLRPTLDSHWAVFDRIGENQVKYNPMFTCEFLNQ